MRELALTGHGAGVARSGASEGTAVGTGGCVEAGASAITAPTFLSSYSSSARWMGFCARRCWPLALLPCLPLSSTMTPCSGLATLGRRTAQTQILEPLMSIPYTG